MCACGNVHNLTSCRRHSRPRCPACCSTACVQAPPTAAGAAPAGARAHFQCLSCRSRRCSGDVLRAEYIASDTASTDQGLTRMAPDRLGEQPTNSARGPRRAQHMHECEQRRRRKQTEAAGRGWKGANDTASHAGAAASLACERLAQHAQRHRPPRAPVRPCTHLTRPACSHAARAPPPRPAAPGGRQRTRTAPGSCRRAWQSPPPRPPPAHMHAAERRGGASGESGRRHVAHCAPAATHASAKACMRNDNEAARCTRACAFAPCKRRCARATARGAPGSAPACSPPGPSGR